MKSYVLAAAAMLPFTLAAPAHAGEIYGGVYAHAADSPFTLSSEESGADLHAGYRLDPIEPLAGVQPYVFASVNTDGDTSFAGVGLSWKLGSGPVYVRPGAGLVVHDAPSRRVSSTTGLRTDLGSRVLFEPEIAVGMQMSERFSIEASWVHISNARIFNSQQNPGIDAFGLRANFRL